MGRQFNASGYNIAAGVAVPKAVVEFIRFNGDGGVGGDAAEPFVSSVSVPQWLVSRSGCVPSSRPPHIAREHQYARIN
jgi:hypothetical protein